MTLRRTHAACTAARQPVVVNIEPPGKTKPAIERKARDEPGCGISRVAKDACEGRHGRRQYKCPIVANPVADRRESREHRRVRRRGQRRMHDRSLEADAARGEPIERRGRSAGGAVGAHVIPSQRIDGDQQDIRGRCGPRRVRPMRPHQDGGQRPRREHDDRRDAKAAASHRPSSFNRRRMSG